MTMCKRLSFLTSFLFLVTLVMTPQVLGVPAPGAALRVSAVMDFGTDLGASSSMYNPRSYGGRNYVVQINAPNRGVGCYPVGSTDYEAVAGIGDGAEARMADAFPAASYVLLAGGADNDYFSRIDPDLNLDSRVLATNLGVRPSSYDWVDDDTIIHNSYASGLRSNLYLTDVSVEPFQVSANTDWNANGYVTTGATSRIRNVRVGDVYRGYAYYGDSGVNAAGFWAIDLATGVSTLLGTLDVTGDGSWGLWTVKEVDGFLYVHTTHNGIYVYSMSDATTLGALHSRYTKEELDALTGDTNPNWGFDVVDDGSRMLLCGGVGKVIEIIDARVAGAPQPPDGAVDVRRTASLEWSSGQAAASHDVYFGVVFDDVDNASRTDPRGVLVSQGQTATSYDPPGVLDFDTTYYWRIDEVMAPPDNTIVKGAVWSFTTEPFAYSIQGVVASSNGVSDGISTAQRTVDGSGLNQDDQHSTEASDMWLAGPPDDEALYVQFEFGGVHKLHEMLVWNYNAEFELILGFGLRNVTVEFSENGTDWTILDTVEFAQATARATYTANTTVEFGGVAARYVRLTVNSGWSAAGQFGLSEVRFLHIPAQAREPQPADGAAEVEIGTALSWRSGRQAVSHQVYLGTAPDALTPAGTVDSESFAPDNLEFGATYYWRIDEVNEADAVAVWPGAVWSFTTAEYAVVDDFESYNDDVDAKTTIFDTWLDGWVNNTGSTVGYLNAPFAEQTIVHSGRQSMPLTYDNSASPFYSDAERVFGDPQDWTIGGADSLRLYFRGAAANSPQTLYVTLQDSAGRSAAVGHVDPGAILATEWQQWRIPLGEFGDVSLTRIEKMTIGVGNRTSPAAGGTGIVYIDDIGCGRPRNVE